MNNNVGMADRLARIVLGIALIAFAIPVGFPATGWNWVGWIGVVPLLTGLVGWCPLYAMLGICTTPGKALRQR